jgi:hypothetical protein
MKRSKSIILAALAVLVAVGLFAPALPAETAHAQSSAALSITPKKTYLVSPGASVSDTLVITNLDSSNALNLTLRVIDFTYTDNGGTPKLFLDPTAPQTTWSLKPYMTVPTTATIGPGDSQKLNMKVSIPANVGAGSYYSAIIYSTGEPDGSGNVALNASGVTLVFVQVPGKVTENLALKKFGAYDATVQGGALSGYEYFTDKQPTTIAYTLQNKGNVTESPVGSIKLKYMFGQETDITNVNPSSSLALIGQTRTYQACIKLQSAVVALSSTTAQSNVCASPGLWPGHYTASLDVFYGQNGNNTQEITGTAGFWYLPMWFVVSFLVLLAIIALVVWRLVVAIRKLLYGPRRSSVRRRR